MYRLFCIVIFAICVATCRNEAAAEVSLAMEDRFEDIAVEVDGVKTVFTVFRDAWNARQWYVVPDRPRLVERLDRDGKKIPELSLILIQSGNDTATDISEEAVLQFAVSLAPPAAALETIKEKIAAQYKTEQLNPSQITLSGLPLVSSQATVVIPGKGEFLVENATPAGNGIGPSFSSQNQIFQLHLSKKGANFVSTALKEGNGLPIQYVLNYEGLTPKAGFKVKVHWDQLAHHYSEQVKAKVRGSWFGWFGGSYEYNRQEVLNELTNNKSLEVEVIEGSGFKQEDAYKFLDPIIARINKEFEMQLAPPKEVTPAEAADPKATGFFFGAGYASSVKEITTKKTGDEVITFSSRQYIVKPTIADGFISLKPYPKEIVDQAVIIVPPGPWQSSFFMLPPVGTNLGITAASLILKLDRGTENLLTDTVSWKPNKEGVGEWREKKGNPVSVIAIPLLSLGITSDTLKQSKFNLSIVLTTEDGEVTIQREMPTFNGSLPMPSLGQNLVDIVKVNATPLTFSKLDPTSNLVATHISLKAGDQRVSRAIIPFMDNGTQSAPKPVYFFVPKDEGGKETPIEAIVQYQKKGQKPGQYTEYLKTSNLRDLVPSLDLILTDE